MCARFTRTYTWADLVALYRLAQLPINLSPRYNIAPNATIDVVVQRDGARELAPMRWGFIPSWWKLSVADLPLSFCARAETVKSKPMFRRAYKRTRCLIPVSGYYAWATTPSGKQPYYVTSADGGVLSIAGLWDEWHDPISGLTLQSCMMLNTHANKLTDRVHDRMPVLLARESHRAWLEGSIDIETLRPPLDPMLTMWRVSRRVNKAFDTDDGTLIAPV
jgi:putative SOS response-associated peptidase YedK